MSSLTHWLLAARPKTLSVTLTPVLAGLALAWAEAGSFALPVALATLGTALLIQIGTNLHNDAADFETGADTAERIGPARASAQGWLPPQRVKTAALVCFATAFCLGLYLSWVGGWEIFALGVTSLATGWAYSGGPKPIAYGPLGELVVLLFFGIAAVAGTYYLQALQLSPSAFWVGTAIGMPAAAVLLLNNYRDQLQDRRAGRRTLAIVLGNGPSRAVYGLLLFLPFALPALLGRPWTWLCLLALPAAGLLLRRFLNTPIGPALNQILALTAQLQLGYGVLLAIGLVLGA